MARNGTGTFLRLYSWATDKINSIPITASRVDAEFDGIATALSQSIATNGESVITANIPLNSFKLTGLGVGTARTDAITVGQVQDNQFLYLGTTSGTADAYTLAPSPAITAYTATQQFTAKISATNLTTTPYLQVSSIASPATTAVIKKLSATKTEIAVEASDLLINGIYDFKRNSANDAWIVLNPEKAFYNFTNGSAASTTNKGIAFLSKDILISNNVGTPNSKIDFTDGVMIFDDGSGAINSSAMTGDLANLFGTSDGMLDTGTKANTSDYSLFAVYNPTTGIIKPLASLSRTAPTMPSGFTKKEYRGKILTDASGNIIAFVQRKDNIDLTGTYPFKQFSANPTTFTDINFATNYCKDVVQNINIQLQVVAAITTSWFYYRAKNTSNNGIILTSGEEDTASVNCYIFWIMNVLADSTGTWQYRSYASNSFTTATGRGFYLTGWNDTNLKIRG